MNQLFAHPCKTMSVSVFNDDSNAKSYIGKVELTPNGLKFHRSGPVKQKKGGGRRGKIRGLSLASARRLRERLFRCDYRPPGMGVLGVCLTLPREASRGVGEAVWAELRNLRKRISGLVALLWRKEIQRNGREHFHVVLWFDEPESLRTVGTLVRWWCRLVAKRCASPKATERKMLRSHCKGYDSAFDLPSFQSSPSVWKVPYAQIVESMPCLTAINSDGRGIQYLVDHTSRHKSHQARTSGRAWGVWNRKQLPLMPSARSLHVRLRWSEEVALARLIRHLVRYPIKSRCIFGWHWHYGRRFDHGASVLPSPTKAAAVRRWLEEKGIDAHALYQ